MYRELLPSVEAAVPAAKKGQRNCTRHACHYRVEPGIATPLGRWRCVGKDRRGGDIGSVEAEAVVTFLQRFQQKCDLLRSAGRIKTYQPNRRPRAKDGDHDRFVIDRVHENVAAVALMIERIEFHFSDPAGQLTGGGKGSGSE